MGGRLHACFSPGFMGKVSYCYTVFVGGRSALVIRSTKIYRRLLLKFLPVLKNIINNTFAEETSGPFETSSQPLRNRQALGP